MYGLDQLYIMDEEAMRCLGIPTPVIEHRGLRLIYDPGEAINEHRVLIDIGKEKASGLSNTSQAFRLWLREYVVAGQLIRQGVEPGNIVVVMPDSWDPSLQARLATLLYPRVIGDNDLGIKLMLVTHHASMLGSQYRELLRLGGDNLVIGITMHRLPLMGKTIECFREPNTCIRHMVGVIKAVPATHYHLLGIPRTVLRRLPPVLARLRRENSFTVTGDTLVWKRPGSERTRRVCGAVPRGCGCLVTMLREFLLINQH